MFSNRRVLGVGEHKEHFSLGRLVPTARTHAHTHTDTHVLYKLEFETYHTTAGGSHRPTSIIAETKTKPTRLPRTDLPLYVSAHQNETAPPSFREVVATYIHACIRAYVRTYANMCMHTAGICANAARQYHVIPAHTYTTYNIQTCL